MSNVPTQYVPCWLKLETYTRLQSNYVCMHAPRTQDRIDRTEPNTVWYRTVPQWHSPRGSPLYMHDSLPELSDCDQFKLTRPTGNEATKHGRHSTFKPMHTYTYVRYRRAACMVYKHTWFSVKFIIYNTGDPLQKPCKNSNIQLGSNDKEATMCAR